MNYSRSNYLPQPDSGRPSVGNQNEFKKYITENSQDTPLGPKKMQGQLGHKHKIDILKSFDKQNVNK